MISCVKCGDTDGPWISTSKGFICEKCYKELLDKEDKLSKEDQEITDVLIKLAKKAFENDVSVITASIRLETLKGPKKLIATIEYSVEDEDSDEGERH